jgi:multiple sugar transport system permease protein
MTSMVTPLANLDANSQSPGAASSSSWAWRASAWRWASLSPLILFYLLLTALPVLNLLVMSVNDVTWSGGNSTWQFVGPQHLAAVFRDPIYRVGVLNTAWFSLVSVTVQMVLGFMLALLVSRTTRNRQFWRMLFLLPILIPGIVIGAIWKLMYDPDFGVINQVLHLFGAIGRDWTGTKELAMASIMAVDVWHWTPFVFLLMLAGLESLPQDVFEAARIDATPWWRELTQITLPLMLPTIVVTLVFRIVLAFKVFDEIYLLTSGGPGTATEVISFSIYRTFFVQGRVGYGSALSLVTISIMAMVIIIALNLQSRLTRTPS